MAPWTAGAAAKNASAAVDPKIAPKDRRAFFIVLSLSAARSPGMDGVSFSPNSLRVIGRLADQEPNPKTVSHVLSISSTELSLQAGVNLGRLDTRSKADSQVLGAGGAI